MDKIRSYHVAGAGLVLALALAAGIFWLAVIDSNPPIVVEQPLNVEPDTVSPGQLVVMTSSFCKYTEAGSQLSAFWQREGDGLIWQLKQQQNAVSGKGCGVLSIPLIVPADMPPGRWQRVNIATYQVNPIGRHVAEWRSEFIEVLPAPTPEP